jgi:hypothetical protein
MRIISIILFLINCTSCNTDEPEDFYRYSMLEHDVWRLPIHEPYQLITAYCCESWNLGRELMKDLKSSMTVDSINYDHNYISLYTPEGRFHWHAFDVRTKIAESFKTREAFYPFRSCITYLEKINEPYSAPHS